MGKKSLAFDYIGLKVWNGCIWCRSVGKLCSTALKTLLHPALAAIMCFCLCLRSSVCVPWSKHVTWSCASRVSKNILSFDARNNPPANFPVWRIEIFHEKKVKTKTKMWGTRDSNHRPFACESDALTIRPRRLADEKGQKTGYKL